ncbi:MAG: hypothetical protein R2780_13000 [Crocinitomicaceae bacterium]
METTFSSLGQDGITPSITIGNDCHEVQFGPRISYQHFSKSSSKGKIPMVFDFGYRMNYFNKIRGLSLFWSIRNEYTQDKGTEYWTFDPDNITDWRMDLGDEPIDMKTSTRTRKFTFMLGTGAEYIFVNQLYLKGEAGYGLSFNGAREDHINTSTNEIMRVTGNFMLPKFNAWIVSAGLGFRF